MNDLPISPNANAAATSAAPISPTPAPSVSAMPVAAAPAASQKTKQKPRPLIIFIDIICVMLSLAFIAWLICGQAIRDYFVGLNYTPSPEMASTIEKINLTWRGNLVVQAVQPTFASADDFNANCLDGNEEGNITTLGCFLPSDDRIYIYDIHSDELEGIKESVLAHELLHAIYNRLNGIERSNLNAELNNYYQAHQADFGDYMSSYSEDQYYTELHSLIGQRVHYQDLSASLRSHYASYFADQDVIVDFYDQYHDTIDKLTAQIEAGKAEIDTLYAELDAKRTQFRQELEQYNTDVEYHNTQVELGYYDESRYRSLKQRETQLDSDLETLNQLIDTYNAKAQAYNELLERQQQLYGRMDSRAKIQTQETE